MQAQRGHSIADGGPATLGQSVKVSGFRLPEQDESVSSSGHTAGHLRCSLRRPQERDAAMAAEPDNTIKLWG